MSDELKETEKLVAESLEKINELSPTEIDQKISAIRTFVDESVETLNKQINDLKRKYDRQTALLEAARASLKE